MERGRPSTVLDLISQANTRAKNLGLVGPMRLAFITGVLDAEIRVAEPASDAFEDWKRDTAASRLGCRAGYDRDNPLGGPAKMFDAIAERIRAGEDYHEVLRDYGVTIEWRGREESRGTERGAPDDVDAPQADGPSPSPSTLDELRAEVTSLSAQVERLKSAPLTDDECDRIADEIKYQTGNTWPSRFRVRAVLAAAGRYEAHCRYEADKCVAPPIWCADHAPRGEAPRVTVSREQAIEAMARAMRIWRAWLASTEDQAGFAYDALVKLGVVNP